jgi:phosphoribosylaminoimidazolecarboxamide formyltransferase/IMP cyclohydrolase
MGSEDAGSKILSVNGGLLVQDNDIAKVMEKDLKVVSEREPSPEEIKLLICLEGL